MINDFAWRFGGESGEGIDSTGHIFAQAMARYGLHIYTYRSFPSRIRGGLTYYEVRATDEPKRARADELNLCGALGQSTVDASVDDLCDGGVLMWDSDEFTPKYETDKEVLEVPVPMTSIADEHGSKIMRNMAGIGATAALLDIDRKLFYEFVKERFGSKGQKIVDANKAVIDDGYATAKDELGVEVPWTAEKRDLPNGRRLLIDATQATSFGALVAGCRFMAGYPITPATDVLTWFIDKTREYGGEVVQAEDELAAINYTIGAGYAGVRAMAPTSGPGMSLMTEALGLAGTAEIPVVLCDVMRAGPSTGMPTKHSQGDLLFAVHGGHENFPRIVVSPSTTEEAFYLVQESFNYAERYQCPVFYLLDQDLGISGQTWDQFDVDRVPVDRGKLLTNDELQDRDSMRLDRFAITDDGISPRSRPGQPNGLFHTTGVEHTPEGFVSESRTNRNAQMEKRERKMRTFAEQHYDGQGRTPAVEPVQVSGPEDAPTGIVTWGSTRAPVEEARARLADDGVETRQLVLTHLWPYPRKQMRAFLDSVDTALFIDATFNSQLALLTQQEIGYHDKITPVTKYDGTPYRPHEVVTAIQEAL